jgi:hypothetical protein
MSDKIQTNIVRVRFPNESYYDTIPNFNWDEFRGVKYNYDCVFGWYQDVYVCVNKDDYDNRENSREDDNN